MTGVLRLVYYVKHLRRRELRRWQQGEALFDEARALRPPNLEAAVAWVNGPRAGAGSREERAANLGAILSAQAHWLAERLLDRKARDFEAGAASPNGSTKPARPNERSGRVEGRRQIKQAATANGGRPLRRRLLRPFCPFLLLCFTSAPAHAIMAGGEFALPEDRPS